MDSVSSPKCHRCGFLLCLTALLSPAVSSGMTAADPSFVVSHLIEGRSFALASFVLVLYDYLITFDDEIKYFWRGPWNISRILFFCNRYFPPLLMILRVIIDFYPQLFPSEFCNIALRINFPLNIFALTIIQATLVIRTWYLFAYSRLAQRLVLTTYITCTLGTIAMLALSIPGLHSHLEKHPDNPIYYCAEPLKASSVALIFVPSFLLHAMLSAFIVARVTHNVRSNRHLLVRQAVMRDGGFLYLVVFFSVSFSISAAIFGDSPSIGVVAMFANFMLALTSICVSRVVLHLMRLSSLHARFPFSKDPALLLYTAKTNRSLNWQTKFMGCLVYVPSPAEQGPYGDGYNSDEAEDDVLEDDMHHGKEKEQNGFL